MGAATSDTGNQSAVSTAIQPPDRVLEYAEAIGRLKSISDVESLDALLARAIGVFGSVAEISPGFCASLLKLLRFTRSEGLAWLRIVAERFVNPLMSWALATDRLDLADMLTVTSYFEFVQADERESHFATEVAKWSRPWSEAANRHAERHPIRLMDVNGVRSGARYKVAFLLMTGAALGHTEVLVSVLTGYRRQAFQPFDPIVVVFSGPPGGWAQALEAEGIEVIALERNSADTRLGTMATALRRWCADQRVVALVQVSAVTSMPFLFSLPVAPVQIWWALKYHAFEHPKIDGYLTGGHAQGGFRQINGRTWRVGHPAYRDLVDPGARARAAPVRAQFPPDAVLLATVAREEKMMATAYLGSVAAILKRNPKAHFIWTGRARDPSIAAALSAPDIADRVHFAGWVDTRLLAQVLDVFLDSFPAPCGITLYQAMAAGKPAVLFDSHESRTAGLAGIIGSQIEGSYGQREDQQRVSGIFRGAGTDPMFLLARTVDDYVELATRLIEDAEYRLAAGCAASHYADEYFSNLRRSGESYARCIDDIVREIADRRAAGDV
ncbi:MAG: glycosyltransferase [Alphaproteobacteria bacterium]|nr:glycosyltransferase [Alphaproteobacteria bacterium]